MRTNRGSSALGVALTCASLGGCFLLGDEEGDAAPRACDPTLQPDWHTCAGGRTDDCPSDTFCGLDLEAACPCGGRDCEAPRRCLPAAGSGAVAPLGACDSPEACGSGRCVTPPGLCEAPCDPDSTLPNDCAGLSCVAVVVDGRDGHLCAPVDDGGGGAGPGALCSRDDECPDGELCAVLEADGLDEPLLPGAWTACVPRPPIDDAFRACDDAPTDAARNALCPTRGFCVEACEDNVAFACDVRSCARPCHGPADCPFRYECGGDTNWNVREGTDALRVCQLHDVSDVGWGCFDDADCCVFGTDEDPRQENGGLCCTVTGEVGQRVCTTPPVRTHCGIQQNSGALEPHVVTRCRAPDEFERTTRLPGEACTEPEQCSTGVCAPDGAGGGLCVQLCSLGDEGIARRPSATSALADPCDPFGEGGGRSCVLQVVRGLGYVEPLCLPVCGVPGAGRSCTEAGRPAP